MGATVQAFIVYGVSVRKAELIKTAVEASQRDVDYISKISCLDFRKNPLDNGENTFVFCKNIGDEISGDRWLCVKPVPSNNMTLTDEKRQEFVNALCYLGIQDQPEWILCAWNE